METTLLEENKDITSLTTFGVPAKARWYAEYSSVKELQKILKTQQFQEGPVCHIGDGSNLLFRGTFDGIVIRSNISGIQFYEKDSATTYAIAGAAEKMDDLIAQSVERNLSGIENLSGIPGQVGAAPVQNVGAYGVEAKDVIHKVEAYDLWSHRIVTFDASQCGFGYRDSIFKNDSKGRYVILRVSFRLAKSQTAKNLAYGPLKQLEADLGHTPSPGEVREAILQIRAAKLPDPNREGSAGSFFKNPVVSRAFYEHIIRPEFPDCPHYDVDEESVKIPAGWLIEKAGLKGAEIGGAQVYPKQCLVIANKGNATADDVVNLAHKVIWEVNRKFSIRLCPEVNIIESELHIEVLGSGTSRGVPEPGCLCDVCMSKDPRDNRLRCSVVVRTQGLTLLIDPSPDLRQQLIRANVFHIDAVLITHSHYDHVGGIDDLRAYCEHSALPLYMSKDVEGDLRRRIDYCFRPHPYPGIPRFEIHNIEANTPFYIKGIKITPIEVMHAKLPILGFRIGKFGYITDAKTIAPDQLTKLENLDVLFINALRKEQHFSHLNLEEALNIIKSLTPEKAYITHISHGLGLFDEVSSELPENVFLAYDGLKCIASLAK